MKKRKWLKTGLTVLFILLAGILYSCREVNKQDQQVFLQNQESNDQELQVNTSNQEINSTENEVQALKEDPQVSVKDSVQYIYIHICGAVKEPNVYEVEQNTRLISLIKLAGGLTEDAAGDYVNQAALVQDGQQIYIPTKEEVEGMTPTNYEVNESSDNVIVSSKVNINTATMETLMTLSGIGESKAKSIIAYRQDNDGFKAIEEIKNIDGIKDAVYNKIFDLITVNE